MESVAASGPTGSTASYSTAASRYSTRATPPPGGSSTSTPWTCRSSAGPSSCTSRASGSDRRSAPGAAGPAPRGRRTDRWTSEQDRAGGVRRHNRCAARQLGEGSARRARGRALGAARPARPGGGPATAAVLQRGAARGGADHVIPVRRPHAADVRARLVGSPRRRHAADRGAAPVPAAGGSIHLQLPALRVAAREVVTDAGALAARAVVVATDAD